MLHSQFAIFCLAAGLLRYYPQDAILAGVSRKAAHDEFILFRGEGRGVHHVDPEGHPAGYPVNVQSDLTRPWGLV